MLEQAASEGWRAVTLKSISDNTGLSLSDVCETFPTKQAVLEGFLADIDRKVRDGTAADILDDSPRDRLFDVLMRRFDLLQPHKDAVANILCDLPRDPIACLCGLPRFAQSMGRMLEAAHLSSKGISGALKIKGLAAVYLNAARVWLRDDTPDMSKTMAALDKGLRRADGLAAVVFNKRSTS